MAFAEPDFSGASASTATSVAAPSAFETLEARLATASAEASRLAGRIAELEHSIVSVPVLAARQQHANRDLILAPDDKLRAGIFSSNEHPDSAAASPRFRKRQQRANRLRAVLVSLFLIGAIGLVLYLLRTLASG